MPSSAPVRIIAHRGGVVGDAYVENSAASLEAAVERGYWMIEVDVRESRDGKLIVNHDPDFRRFFNDPRLVADVDWQEIATLRGDPGGARPLQFHELAALAKGRLRLMIDPKPAEQSNAYFDGVVGVLRANDLLDTAYVIDQRHSERWVRSGTRVGLPVADLEAARNRGEDVANSYFVFEHGRDLDADKVRRGQALGVPIVPSINIFHYGDLGDHMPAARADVHRMLDLGVEEFQIDSPYDVWLR